MSAPFTYLFVPGNRPERFDKALASGADAIVIDLEDAVAEGDKAKARDNISAWITTQVDAGKRVLVRINDAATRWFDADLAFLRGAGIRGVMLPKAEDATQIERVRAGIAAGGFVVPIIESARGLHAVDGIAGAASVQRLAFGTIDYAVDLGMSDDERGLVYPACKVAIASRVAGILSPIAGVTTDIANEERLFADLAFARACGFGAKLCIHPRQVESLHRALAPRPEDVAWAERVIAAINLGDAPGAAQVDGKMIDGPVVLKAKSILERAKR